jgi:hypothetical protein
VDDEKQPDEDIRRREKGVAGYCIMILVNFGGG